MAAAATTDNKGHDNDLWPDEGGTESYYFWRLEGKLAVPCSTLAWAQCLEDSLGRRVAETQIGPMWVSTVFLGLNHRFGPGPPLIFETMIFRGGDGHETWRSTSWVEAELFHERAVMRVRQEIIDSANEKPQP